MLDAYWSVTLAQHDCKVDRIGRIRRITVVSPLEISQAASVAVMTAMMHGSLKLLSHRIRHDDRHPARPAVWSGGCHASFESPRCCQVTGRIVFAVGIGLPVR